MNPRTRAGLSLASIPVVTAVLATSAFGAAPLTDPVELPVTEAKVRQAAKAEAKRIARIRRERRQPELAFPVTGKVDFGTEVNMFGNDRGDHIHAGQDVFAPSGTPLVAVSDGVVFEAGSDGGRGNYVYLYNPEADETYAYFHMVEPTKLATGDEVEAGQEIGAVGCTGSCTGDHLHFEVHDGRGYESAHDPMPLLKELYEG